LSLYLWVWNRWAAVILGVDFSVFAVSMAGAKLKSGICRSEGRFGRIEGKEKLPRAYALIAAISAPTPMMFMTRLRL
jgi:hypothetical protein